MPISQRRYVDIASAVIGAGGAAMQKLDGRVFIENEKIFAQDILEFRDPTEVANYFGADSDESRFANHYFALVTPAPVSRAGALQFAPHFATMDRSTTIYGVKDHSRLEILKEIEGDGPDDTFRVVVDEVEATIENVDLSEITSFSDIAAILNDQGEEPALTGVSVSYEGGRFVVRIVSSKTIEIVPTAVSRGLGLVDPDVMIDEGGPQQTMIEAWSKAEEKNPSYGSCFFLNRGSLEECIAVAEANAALNVVHQVYIQVRKSEAQEFFDNLGGTASVGLILQTDDYEYLAHIPMALMSATNYDRANATLNYMFRSPGVTVKPQVTNTNDANLLDELRVNYYGQTAQAGAPIEFFQRAWLCGPASAPLDMSVHANEQWLRARFTALWFDILTQTRGIPSNLDGKARANLVIAEVVKEALRNGVFLRGKDLTPTQKAAITDAAGNDQAWMTVVNHGAWYDVQIKTRTDESLVESYYLDYILVYAKGDWVRKVTGSHNLV